ncbi:PLP-dependent transferase [Parathielavia hyrcaniae]|uniref:PLP-dependent transferase n=1 Tax=Parathielavia hyrcaniae TaxID=113614 RepID=A0AAN6T365_9PEZI|nr:PLP-dependent transferase [Parathielavia hyrcaniae]
MATALNISDVRGKFPALTGDQVYLDNAGGSQALGTVAERSEPATRQARSPQTATTRAMRRQQGTLVPRETRLSDKGTVLGPSTTQLLRNVSYALRFQEGDELIVSAIDHEANIAPWVDFAERQKLVLKWWKPNSDALDAKTNPKLLASDLAALLTDKTRLVTCTHASNILGTIHDIKAIASTVHAHNPQALVCVDAVAYAPHRRIDVKDLGVNFYCFSWYKVYGPHIALLYASPLALSNLHSLGHFFNPHATLENKLGLGAASYELVHALPAVISYLNPDHDDRWAAIAAHEQQLQATLLDWLVSRGGAGGGVITVYGEPSSDSGVRVPTVSFTVEGWGSRELVEAVERESEGVFGFRWGSFYSASMVHYNTVDEVERLIAVLERVLMRGK